MIAISKVLFDALKVALWGYKPQIDLYQSMSVSDWNNLFELASRQTVEALVFDALESLPNDVVIPKDLIKKWCIRVNQIEHRNIYMNQIIREQITVFNDLKIQPILQKGQGIAKYYPNPLHRICGDIDWYLSSVDDFDNACSFAKDNAEKFSRSPKDAFFIWKNQETELHTRLVESRNPLKWNFIKKLEKEHCHELDSLQLEATSVSLPSPLLNILLVNIHILKHQITFGIGLRQLCDAAILYDKLSGMYKPNELLFAYKKLGVVSWAHSFHHLLVTHIGLCESKIPFPIRKSTNSEWMKHDILNAGNFGFTDQRYDVTLFQQSRVNRFKRLGISFNKYLFIAPYETLSFSYFQVFHKFYKIFNKS